MALSTPRGIRNNNPLNLIISNNDWQGKVTTNTDGHFEQFTSIFYGIRAAFINARTILNRNPRCTMKRLIDVWAPPMENNTLAYIDAVAKRSYITPDTILDWRYKNEFCRLLWAMSWVENGQEVPFNYFEKAYVMAFGPGTHGYKPRK